MRLAATILGCALLVAPTPGRAALGGDRRSIDADRKALAGEAREATQGTAFTVERFELRGTSVREYVSARGVVFAVAWEGFTHPDLGTLLGAHGAAWRAAMASAPRSASRSQRRATAGEAVVETWGHMRHLFGRAWLPALVPAGVTLDEIR